MPGAVTVGNVLKLRIYFTQDRCKGARLFTLPHAYCVQFEVVTLCWSQASTTQHDVYKQLQVTALLIYWWWYICGADTS